MGGVEVVKRVYCFIMEKIREKLDFNFKLEEINKNFERYRQVKMNVYLCWFFYVYICSIKYVMVV